MPIAFSTATDSQSTSTSSASVTIPSHNAGDLLVVSIGTTRGSTAPATAINTPSGWSKATDDEAGSASAVRHTIFYKTGDGIESSVSITLSGNPTFGFGATCMVFTDAQDDSTVLDTTGVTTQESGTGITSPSVNAGEDDVMTVFAYVFDDDLASEANIDNGPGFQGTLRGYEEIATPGNGLSTGCSTILKASGATGTCFWNTEDSDAGVAVTATFKSAIPLQQTHQMML